MQKEEEVKNPIKNNGIIKKVMVFFYYFFHFSIIFISFKLRYIFNKFYLYK